MKKPKTIALIPVKSQSTRFPEKNFSEFCNPDKGFRSTLISNTIDKLVKAKVDKIYISTDVPEKVKEIIVSPPAAFTELHIIKRPSSLATPEATTDSLVLDFVKSTGYNHRNTVEDSDIIILCQVTSPVWKPHLLKYAIEKFKQKNKTIISVSPNYQPNGCFYIFTKEMFMEYQSIYYHENGIYLVVLPWEQSIDIDYPHQLPIAEAIKREDYDDY